MDKIRLSLRKVAMIVACLAVITMFAACDNKNGDKDNGNDDDTPGMAIWAKNFGGHMGELFFSVTADSDGYIAVGYANQITFGSGDWVGLTGKGTEGGINDAIIVKFGE